MNIKKLMVKKVLLLLIILALFIMVGCENVSTDKETKKKTTNVSTTSFIQEDSEKVMVIGCFNDPYVDFDTYSVLKESGINRVVVNKTRTNSQVIKILTFCDELGIDCLILDGINNKTTSNPEYMNHKSFAGLDIYDEPSAGQYPEFRAKLDIFEEAYPNKIFYVNLFPDPVDNYKKLQTEDYEEYVERYCEEVLKYVNGEKILSYDIYPLALDNLGNKVLDSRYLYCNELIAKYAKEYGAKASCYIQAMGFGKKRVPTLSGLNFQFYNSLVFGFKDFYYFCYYTPGPNVEFTEEDYAIVDRDCNKTPIYDFVKDINEEMFLLDDIYLRYEWDSTIPVYGTIENDPQFCLCSMENQNSKVGKVTRASSEYDSLIGYFKKGNSEAYMVSNFNDPENDVVNNIEITFNESREVTVYLDGNPVKMNIVDNKLNLSLNPGEGAFIVFD